MATVYFTPRVYVRAVVAIIYTSRTAIRQSDRKRIIAYASVAHMNMTLVGLFSMTEQGGRRSFVPNVVTWIGGVGALFMVIGLGMIGIIHEESAIMEEWAQTMPLFARVFLFFYDGKYCTTRNLIFFCRGKNDFR